MVEKVFVGVYIPRDLDRRVERVAVELDTSKSRLVELGLRVLLAVLESSGIPDDLGYLLRERDPEALAHLTLLGSVQAGARG